MRRVASLPSLGAGEDDLLAAILIRMWALASGRALPRNVRPDQLSEEELITFWADDLSQAVGRHAMLIPGYDGGQAVSQIFSDSAAGPSSGQVCPMLAFDILGFTRQDRDEEVRIYLHKALYEILWEALEGSGVPWDRCHHEDRGDGALVVAAPDILAHGIIDPFPERLRNLIGLHNRMSCPAARMQVRAAAHIGPVYRDDHGLVGDDINLLFRMLDARPLQTALSGSGAELALAISGYMYDSLVRRHPALAARAQFRQINSRVKGTRVKAWMHIPGASPVLPRTPDADGFDADLIAQVSPSDLHALSRGTPPACAIVTLPDVQRAHHSDRCGASRNGTTVCATPRSLTGHDRAGAAKPAEDSPFKTHKTRYSACWRGWWPAEPG